MNVFCPNCNTLYRVDPAKVPENGVRARCAVCSAVFAVRRDASATVAPAPVATPTPAPATERLSETPPAFAARPEPVTVAESAGEPASVGEPRSVAEPATVPEPAVAAVDHLPPPAPAPPPPPPAMERPVFSQSPSASPPSASSRAPSAPVGPAVSSRGTSLPPPAIPSAARATPAGLAIPPAARPAAPAGLPSAAPPGPKSPAGYEAPPPPPAIEQPARPAAEPPAPPAAAPRPINPFLSQDPAAKARRLARALISDMVVYHPAKRQEGLREGTLKDLFDEEIRKSWEEYSEQVGKDIADSTSYFKEALNEILADGRQIF